MNFDWLIGAFDHWLMADLVWCMATVTFGVEPTSVEEINRVFAHLVKDNSEIGRTNCKLPSGAQKAELLNESKAGKNQTIPVWRLQKLDKAGLVNGIKRATGGSSIFLFRLPSYCCK